MKISHIFLLLPPVIYLMLMMGILKTTVKISPTPISVTKMSSFHGPDYGVTCPISPDESQNLVYSVKPGNTLSGIAQDCSVELEAIQEMNPNISPTSLRINEKLIIVPQSTIQERRPLALYKIEYAQHHKNEQSPWWILLFPGILVLYAGAIFYNSYS